MTKVAPSPSSDDEFEYIYTRFIRLKNGRILFAEHYGLKAFRIKVRKNRKPKAQDKE